MSTLLYWVLTNETPAGLLSQVERAIQERHAPYGDWRGFNQGEQCLCLQLMVDRMDFVSSRAEEYCTFIEGSLELDLFELISTYLQKGWKLNGLPQVFYDLRHGYQLKQALTTSNEVEIRHAA